MEIATDEQLISQYLKGDEQSLVLLISRYLKPIYVFVFRNAGNASESEDITQEIFVKVWKSLKKPGLGLLKGFNPKKGNFKAWIFSIAKNACIDYLRKKKAIPFSKLENQDGENSFVDSIKDTALLPSELFNCLDLAEILNVALTKLSPDSRAVLLLRYNDHFTFKEISHTLGEPLNTVKSRHRRALIVLKKLLTA